jgi:hypothetical protein
MFRISQLPPEARAWFGREAIFWPSALTAAIEGGMTRSDDLTNIVFFMHHKERMEDGVGKALDPAEAGFARLADEWRGFRKLVQNSLKQSKQPTSAKPGKARPMSSAEKASSRNAAIKQVLAGKDTTVDAMKAELAKSGITLEKWFADLVPDATFLDMPVKASIGSVPGVHRSFVMRLEVAERWLQARFPGKSKSSLAKQLGVYRISGLRRPKLATGGTRPSLHCYGLAVDINARGNPYIGRSIDKTKKQKGRFKSRYTFDLVARASTVMTGSAIELYGTGWASSDTQRWRLLHEGSEALKAYLQLDDTELASRVRSLREPKESLTWWKRQLEADRKVDQWSEFRGKADPATHGFMDLDRDLVEALSHAELRWGARFSRGKDIMHFDYRAGMNGR